MIKPLPGGCRIKMKLWNGIYAYGTIIQRLFDSYYTIDSPKILYRITWDDEILLAGAYKHERLIPVDIKPINYGEEDD